ncbi:helix-turn-helix transcriptional regulator [Xanthobacter dioxanivorans]|uniref:Helix-turn-helix transcriptional regulator n=1 Tax=Xanthobacter dioxanivorans TaxID=2528964 RepID=A0A974SKC7_9HYPH|nr:helix-turn-helix transcriptional regulator [Xanthobacter dioxanivorans]QRG08695.1 helix-turn-helix transcriptional regulator [Xanthobacter dioxanivorans]
MDLFAANLRARAAALHLSNAEAARRAGLNERRYFHYVSGAREPDLATLVKISKALGTTPDALLGVKREPEDLPEPTERSKLIDRMVSAVNNLDDYELAIAVQQVEVILRLQGEKAAAAKAEKG